MYKTNSRFLQRGLPKPKATLAFAKRSLSEDIARRRVLLCKVLAETFDGFLVVLISHGVEAFCPADLAKPKWSNHRHPSGMGGLVKILRRDKQHIVVSWKGRRQ